ncbi:cytochrome c [uncultured Roseovarius sp.]|uniref:c-type cytochrome n=1 Tax=uncultured Roseovarius sp. TaxID=293344 RepID=UPI00260D75C1|nr:cytochrome c [uncultured Roseovarius sp.]
MRHAFSILLLAACATQPVAAQDARQGEELYLRYCATCHGLDATGYGPMRPVLTVQPIDLTRLTAENKGEFPLVRVIKRIDGRDPLVSHGSPMPIYGELFEGQDISLKTEAGQPIMTSQPVADLVAYITSLQVE